MELNCVPLGDTNDRIVDSALKEQNGSIFRLILFYTPPPEKNARKEQDKGLTLSQTTNFRIFQIKKTCR